MPPAQVLGSQRRARPRRRARPSGVGLDEPVDHPQRRRLAAPRRADQHARPRRAGTSSVRSSTAGALGAVVALRDAVEPDHGAPAFRAWPGVKSRCTPAHRHVRRRARGHDERDRAEQTRSVAVCDTPAEDRTGRASPPRRTRRAWRCRSSAARPSARPRRRPAAAERKLHPAQHLAARSCPMPRPASTCRPARRASPAYVLRTIASSAYSVSAMTTGAHPSPPMPRRRSAGTAAARARRAAPRAGRSSRVRGSSGTRSIAAKTAARARVAEAPACRASRRRTMRDGHGDRRVQRRAARVHRPEAARARCVLAHAMPRCPRRPAAARTATRRRRRGGQGDRKRASLRPRFPAARENETVGGAEQREPDAAVRSSTRANCAAPRRARAAATPESPTSGDDDPRPPTMPRAS